jgi:hypothetical protein
MEVAVLSLRLFLGMLTLLFSSDMDFHLVSVGANAEAR